MGIYVNGKKVKEEKLAPRLAGAINYNDLLTEGTYLIVPGDETPLNAPTKENVKLKVDDFSVDSYKHIVQTAYTASGIPKVYVRNFDGTNGTAWSQIGGVNSPAIFTVYSPEMEVA